MFPPSLSNKNAASKIASKNLANLKRNGELDAFVTAFDKFKEIGTFKQLSEKDIEDWDSKGCLSITLVTMELKSPKLIQLNSH